MTSEEDHELFCAATQGGIGIKSLESGLDLADTVSRQKQRQKRGLAMTSNTHSIEKKSQRTPEVALVLYVMMTVGSIIGLIYVFTRP